MVTRWLALGIPTLVALTGTWLATAAPHHGPGGWSFALTAVPLLALGIVGLVRG